jgi:intraflagellar transport protein 80
MIWLELFKWERALNLATKMNQHVDVVLYARKQYLRTMKMQETNEKFRETSKTVELDEERVKQKIQELEIKELKAFYGS